MIEVQYKFTIIGNQKIIEETDELLSKALFLLRSEIYAEKHKELFPLGEFIKDDTFLLSFLRATKFDIPKALGLLKNYWHFRANVLQITTRRITVDQLDKNTFESGLISVPTGLRDLMGRQVIYFRPHFLDYSKLNQMDIIKVFWYCAELALEDEKTQQLGICIINCTKEATLSNFNRHLASSIIDSVQKRLPVRIGEMLVVYPPTFFSFIWKIFSLFLNPKLKERIHLIYEQEELKKYFNEQNILKEYGGEFEFSHLDWVNECHQKQRED